MCGRKGKAQEPSLPSRQRRGMPPRNVLASAVVAFSFIRTVEPFVVPGPLRARPMPSQPHFASSLEESSLMTTTTATEVSHGGGKGKSKHQPESVRLSNAKKLLEQLVQEDDEPGLSTPNTSSDTSFVGSSSSKQINGFVVNSRTKKIATMRMPPTIDAEILDAGTKLIVPDNVWNNGLLDGSNVVTRYAFRRGVKVAEPLVKYDPEAAEKLLFRQPAKWIVRNVQIAGPIGLWAAGVTWDYITGRSSRRARAVQLRNAISGLGPAIIKAGQALASRPDLLPSEYLEELQKLQDDVPRFSNDLAFATVESELGINFDDVFELTQEEPVAAASIGQVYQARLKANGDLVALKIQRPKCEEIISLDLYVLRWWSGLYNKIFALLNRDINVQSIIDDFGELIYREIDYIAEASNAQRFNELYAGITDVFVPKIYSDLTTRKVLVMEWVDGVRLTDKPSLERYGIEPNMLIDRLVQCSLRQILENGFFHADPHAGNLLALSDGRLCYLDFGMVSYANKMQRNGFMLAVVHIVNRDWSELVRVYQRLGFIPVGTDVRPIEVALERALPDVLNADVSELNFKNVINKLGDIMYTYPFSLPPFYIAIIRCLGVLEGLAIQVDPSSRIISEAYPYVASRVLTDSQEDLQEALRRLALTSDGRVRWGRLEGLLDRAKESKGYDVTAALDVLTNYIISDEGDNLLIELQQQIVDAADSLGAESLGYLRDAARALVVSDEVAAVKAFRSFQNILQQRDTSLIGKEVRGALPPVPPAMRRMGRIIALLDASGGSGDAADVSKFIPIVRKLAQEPKVQRASSEILARLGERILSRSLRAMFGLPPPVFNGGGVGSSTTIFEQGLK